MKLFNYRIKRSFTQILIVLGVAKFGLSTGECQGFVNLGFESAVIVPVGAPYTVNYSLAFPGWTTFTGTNQPSVAGYNTISLGTSAICIIDAANVTGPGSLISGHYTAILETGEEGGLTSFSQTGVVPQGAQSLRFKAWSYGGSFSVSLGGQVLELQTIGTGANYTAYSANIGSWAGQSAQLQFNLSAPEIYAPNFLYLDSIVFAVPEPETYALFFLGIGGLWVFRKTLRAQRV